MRISIWAFLISLAIFWVGSGIFIPPAWSQSTTKEIGPGLKTGKQNYAQYCARCHGATGRGSMAGVPDLSWRGGKANGLGQFEEHLQNRILAGGKLCPAYQGILTSDEVRDVIHFLRMLP
ncbi:MAG: cytochrome c [Magnetococcus sp. DMHC-6]